MPRASRASFVSGGGTYHVIARGNNKMKIFHDGDDYKAYLGLLVACAEEYRVSVFHYVLMPNHVHMLVRPTDGLSAFMQRIQTSYAKRYCMKRQFVGHIWQGRFKSFPVLTDAYLFACGNYIEMNPVRARMVLVPEEWRYSSYKVYALGERDPIITIDPFYPTLGPTEEARQRKYREMIDSTTSKPVPGVSGTRLSQS